MITKTDIKQLADNFAFWILSPVIVSYIFVLSYVIPRFINIQNPIAIIILTVTYLLLLILLVKYTLTTIFRVYNIKYIPILPIVVEKPEFHAKFTKSKLWPFTSCFLTYCLVVYGFGVTYFILNRFIPGAFNTKEALSFLDSIYFSFITASTIGYGDISPVHSAIKSLVVCEVMFHLMFTVLIFSAVASNIYAHLSQPGDKA